ncbi:MAG: VanW family protein [Propioniciclava sp.]|uniref:VanW family protein n=1 Tax=Propioniciclava sp. TaxID=2038686 RepID=UPI0039E6099D
MSQTPANPGTADPARRRRGRIIAILAGAVVVVLGGAYGIAYALSGNTLAPNATIEGVAVGGLTADQAVAKLDAELAERVQAPITLTAADQTLTRTPAELGLAVDAAASVRAAGAEKSFNPVTIWDNLTGGRAHEAVLTRDDAALQAAADELGQLADSDPVNAMLVINQGEAVLNEAVPGRSVDRAATADAVAAAFLDATEVPAVVTETPAEITTDEARKALDEVATPALSAPVTLTAGQKSFEITPAMIGAALTFEEAEGDLKPVLDPAVLAEKAAPALEDLGVKKPQDARFTFTDGTPSIVPSQDGTGIAPEELAAQVSQAMVKASGRTGSVTIAPLKASFTTEMAEKAGVKEITGEFTTHFPATAYRVNNIGKSAGLINGVYVKPGETFSLNTVLGPRTLARGWMAGGAIDGGRVVERMGGGISQTTTTLFNAIFFAGLEDVYHKPHSLYFSRYPMGREATLDYHSVDMKFRNNTDHGVLLQAFTNDPKVGGRGSVTVRVWSTKIYDVKASDPVRSAFRAPGAAIRNNSAVCSPQSAMTGFRVDYNRLFYKNGELVKTEPFHWTYNSLTPVICTNPNARADRIER